MFFIGTFCFYLISDWIHTFSIQSSGRLEMIFFTLTGSSSSSYYVLLDIDVPCYFLWSFPFTSLCVLKRINTFCSDLFWFSSCFSSTFVPRLLSFYYINSVGIGVGIFWLRIYKINSLSLTVLFKKILSFWIYDGCSLIEIYIFCLCNFHFNIFFDSTITISCPTTYPYNYSLSLIKSLLL